MARTPSPRKEKAPLPPTDHNEAELREIIKATTDDIVALERRRKAVNDEIGSKRSSLKALRIDMDGWAAAKRRYAMDPDVRVEFDRSITLVNESLGIPVEQLDMFVADGAATDENDD
jgi:hypothetical protein